MGRVSEPPEPELVHLKAPNGHVIGFTLPLSRHIQEQWDRRQLERVNADGSPFGDGDGGEGSNFTTPPSPERPAPYASKSAWAEYAAAAGAVSGDEAASMTKAELQAATTPSDPVVRDKD